MGLDEKLNSLLKTKEEQEESASKAQDALNEVRKGIQNGESTGDPIKDYIIMTGRFEAPETEKNLRDLTQRIEENQGKQILMIGEKPKRELHAMRSYSFIRRWRLGVIEGELSYDLIGKVKPPKSDLALDEKFVGILLPTKKYFWEGGKTALSMGNPSGVKKGSIKLDMLDVEVLGQPMYQRGIWDHPDVSSALDWGDGLGSLANKERIEILIGEEVELYFSVPGMHIWNLIKKMRSGKKDGEEVDWYRKSFERHKNMDYVTALESIGVEPPSSFLEEDRRRYIESRDKVLETLEKSQSKDSVMRALKNALELNMHKTPLKREIKLGVTMDVPKYLIGLCNQYGVKISE